MDNVRGGAVRKENGRNERQREGNDGEEAYTHQRGFCETGGRRKRTGRRGPAKKEREVNGTDGGP